MKDQTTKYSEPKDEFVFYVTGTSYGTYYAAKSEGHARRQFHKEFRGESITHVKTYDKAYRYKRLMERGENRKKNKPPKEDSYL